jgi:predicted RNase H-like HicB family nuclease
VLANRFIMNQFHLKAEFTEEFFEEFQFDAEFRSIFESMTRGLTPYEAIEHLCKSKKELFQSLERAIENTPTKIIVTTERFEQLKDEIKQ